MCIRDSLGIHSLLKKQPLKHNVIDRDKVVIPPNWDSWGKIRVLRDGFDVDTVSTGWSIDLDQPFPRSLPTENGHGHTNGGHPTTDPHDPSDPEGSTVALYEDSVQDPSMDALQLAGRNTHSTVLEVETIDTQTFLGQQLKVLDAFKQKSAEEAAREDSRHRIGHGSGNRGRAEDEHLVGGGDEVAEARVLEHIGPVQFNMGGIQVDADDMVQRLKVSRFLSPPLQNMLLTVRCPGTPSLRLVPRTGQPDDRGGHGVDAAHAPGGLAGFLPGADEQARAGGQVAAHTG